MENKKYTVLIVEDMIDARELIASFVEKRPELTLKATARNGEEALKLLRENNYDLALMDIHLPILSGIEVMEKLDRLPYIIFTTAYDNYAIKAFELGAIDYLLKPIEEERFNRAIHRFTRITSSGGTEAASTRDVALSFRENRRVCLVPHEDIIYCSAHGKHCIIHTEEKDFDASMMLKDAEEKLPPDSFLRIHKGFIVNTHAIASLIHDQGGQYIARIRDADDTVLPVGRAYVQNLKEKLRL